MRRSWAGSAASMPAALIVLALALPASGHQTRLESGGAGPADTDYLFELSLEELLTLDLTGVARRAQSLSDTAAAAFVITAEDIKRSGAASIAEALRMAPGVDVGAIDGNTYAISARGFNDRYATKMLVMIDGRAVYTPAYSGVYWEIQDFPMAEIERIEVVRGPGGALWGVNAVNGVINVVTRSAGNDPGGVVYGAAGDKLNYEVSGSWEARSDSGGFRVYGHREDWDGNRDEAGNPLEDTREFTRIGGRLDWSPGTADDLTVSGSIYFADSGVSLAQLQSDPPFERERFDDQRDTDGAYLVGSWRHRNDAGDESTLSGYVDYMDRSDPSYGEEKTTLEVDFQQHWLRMDGHDLIAGVMIRYHDIELIGSDSNFFVDTDYENLVISAFAQDEMELVDDALFLTLGARLEHNDFSDASLEFMPTARLRWKQSNSTTYWAAVSRAVRAPNLGEQYSLISLPLEDFVLDAIPSDLGFPAFLKLQGSGAMKSEDLTAYELGFRSQLQKDLAFDATVYYHEYENVRWPEFTGIVCDPDTLPFAACLADPDLRSVSFLTLLGNGSRGDQYGAELSMNWRVHSDWQLMAAYSGLELTNESDNEVDPQDYGYLQQFSLQSRHNIGERLELDWWLRYADEVGFYDIDDYWSLNLRLAYRFSDDIEVSLFGTDLLDEGRREYETEVRDLVPVEIERAIRAEIRWRF